VIRTCNYVISAENAEREPLFVGFANTIEEARKIKFNAQLVYSCVDRRRQAERG
jgi:hypothetical protein